MRWLFWFLQRTVEVSSLRTTGLWGAMGTEGYRYFYPHVPTASACNINHRFASSEQSCQDQRPIPVFGNALISVLRTTSTHPLTHLLSRFPLCTSIFGLILDNLNLFTEDTVLTDTEMALSHTHALVGLLIVLWQDGHSSLNHFILTLCTRI